MRERGKESMKLLKMVLDNFMCYEHKEIDFYDCTVISGANGRGKSSIASAYTWVMFDCDYNLKSSPTVRREIGGEPVEDDVEVTLKFEANDSEVTLRKIQKRKYSKDGDTYKDDNKYFINDVPKTKKDFESYLGIDMKILKACSNIDYFVSQKPEEMRSYLFSLADNISDLDICKKTADLADLEHELQKHTAEELTAMSKKKIADAEKEIPVLKGRIKEKTEELKQRSEFDLAELELKRNAIKEGLAENRRKQADNQKLLDDYDSTMEEVMQLKFKLSDIQNAANTALGKERGTINKEISDLRMRENELKTEIAIRNSRAGTVKIEVANLEKHKNNLASQWKVERQREIEPDKKICPYCRREFPEVELEKLAIEFEKEQESKLHNIELDGSTAKEKIEELNRQLNGIEKEVKDLKGKLGFVEEKIIFLQEKLDKLPKFADVQDNEEYKKVLAEIAEKEKTMGSFRNFQELKEQLMGEEDDLNEGLKSTERIIDWANTEAIEKRLEKLTVRREELEQNKADGERMIYLLDELKKAKNALLADEINSKFNLIRWKLFDYAKNGNYKSVCVPMMDEKSILTTISNKGNRILGRVDICKSLQEIAGISVPIWLDDCEALDADNQRKAVNVVDGQLIMLIVNGSKGLEVRNAK